MNLTLQPASERPLPELADVINRAFTGYIGGEIHLDTAGLLGFVARDNVDLNLSYVVLDGATPVAIALIARQGWTSRLAMMGVVAEAQGQGVGKWFIGELIAKSRARGDHYFVLEVIEQNPRGVRLYEGAGFQKVRRLTGYSLANPTGANGGKPLEIDVFEAARVVMQHESPDVPWQVSGTMLARLGPPNRAYRLGEAYAIIANPDNAAIRLHALIVPPEQRRQGHATRLLQTLFAQFPGKRWTIPAICPEEYGQQILEPNGFQRDKISQWQMVLTH